MSSDGNCSDCAKALVKRKAKYLILADDGKPMMSRAFRRVCGAHLEKAVKAAWVSNEKHRTGYDQCEEIG